MKITITSNAPKFLKKLEKDVNEFNSGIGRGVADLTNMAFKEIREKKLISGKYAKTRKRIGNPLRKNFSQKRYGTFAGANKTDRAGRNVFHKSKIVSRGDKFRNRFNTITWTKTIPFGNTVAKGHNGSNDTTFRIFRNGKIFSSVVEYTGKTRFLLGNLQYGSRGKKDGTVKPGESLTEKRNGRLGQRRGVANGYRVALRKWNKIVKGVMDGSVKKMGSA